MKKFRDTVLLLAAALCTGCYHGLHDLADTSPGTGGDTGYLAANLNYEFPEDADVPLQDLRIDVMGNGVEATSDFSSMEDAAVWLQQLPVGEYDVLVTQDMTNADGYRLQDGVVALSDPASSPSQSWYAMAHVTVRSSEVTIAEFRLQRLMASLELNISHVPEGTTIDVTVDHMAGSVDLMADDYRGRLGQPASDFIAVPLGKASQRGATRTVSLGTGQQTFLPTSRDFDRTFIDLWVITPEGKELFCLGDTPRMESGYDYVIDLDYTKLKPYMYLEWYRINDWTYGAVITGDVELPDGGN